MRFFILLGCFIHFGCKSVFTHQGKSNLHGTIVTCIEDSTSFYDSNTILVKLNASEKEVANKSCPNRPTFAFPFPDWPANVVFNFKEKYFLLGTNMKYINNDQDNIVDQVGLIPKGGKLHYDNKKRVLTLSASDIAWSKQFKMEFDSTGNYLTLKAQ
jgi:hypothetical protein